MDEELRAAIARGFYVENLWAIVRLCTKLLKTGRLAHPIIALTIKGICVQLASSQEGEAVPGEQAELVEAHLRPAMEALLDVAHGTPAQVCEALDHLARVQADTLPG